MCNVALSSVEADVYIWRYALLVVHARKEDVFSRKTSGLWNRGDNSADSC